MQEQYKYDYVVIRVTPKVEREEFINAGIILFCSAKEFLNAEICLDEQRLKVLDPEADITLVQNHLDTIPRICKGGKDSGPIGQLSLRERFHWLVAPRSTVIQTSKVHSGYTKDPAAALEHLVSKMVKCTSAEVKKS